MFEILKFLSIYNYYQPDMTLRLRPISEISEGLVKNKGLAIWRGWIMCSWKAVQVKILPRLLELVPLNLKGQMYPQNKQVEFKHKW